MIVIPAKVCCPFENRGKNPLLHNASDRTQTFPIVGKGTRKVKKKTEKRHHLVTAGVRNQFFGFL
jgi:hypothetical protein